ncbi:RNA 2'-phosphotransferase [Ignicoccus islandicus DSM 13165]|uniref:Probable RNA 2'-phosphotransferase n=1 Tax=Ignicoccus islandicus DSM 13165 TaxID=940295 RepID=A0A0U2M9E5_9CREN|nr:RNA 2'-phosphotransferase [Ignicoccus islandicus]ALU11613.1 RNA 2'-phosphotransferase [Ignicoccus islandicus DSM 13165]
MDDRTKVKISKYMTYLLRHKPDFVDRHGWVTLDRLLREVRKKFPEVNLEDIIEIAREDEKGRYEISGNKIRARYGHTFPVTIEMEEDYEGKLFHGTSCENAMKIINEGIKPMKRTYVHLATTLDIAIENAKRKGKCIVVFEVDPLCLKSKGLKVYKASEKIRVTNYVPPECIKEVLRTVLGK